jgi:hypothetical protein
VKFIKFLMDVGKVVSFLVLLFAVAFVAITICCTIAISSASVASKIVEWLGGVVFG